MKIDYFDLKISKNEKYKNWLKECYVHAKKSNHPSTHVAAILINKDKVVLKGLNAFPPGVIQKKDRFKGKNRHVYLNHAERDVIYKAAKKGISTNNLTMVMPWLPCICCANAIISSGIKRLVVHKQMVEKTSEDWKEELKDALTVLDEAKVKVIAYEGIIGTKAYMHQKMWDA